MQKTTTTNIHRTDNPSVRFKAHIMPSTVELTTGKTLWQIIPSLFRVCQIVVAGDHIQCVIAAPLTWVAVCVSDDGEEVCQLQDSRLLCLITKRERERVRNPRVNGAPVAWVCSNGADASRLLVGKLCRHGCYHHKASAFLSPGTFFWPFHHG